MKGWLELVCGLLFAGGFLVGRFGSWSETCFADRTLTPTKDLQQRKPDADDQWNMENGWKVTARARVLLRN